MPLKLTLPGTKPSEQRPAPRRYESPREFAWARVAEKAKELQARRPAPAPMPSQAAAPAAPSAPAPSANFVPVARDAGGRIERIGGTRIIRDAAGTMIGYEK